MTTPPESPLDRLRAYAIATADINPHLLCDVDRGWIRPHGGLMNFIDRFTPGLQAVVTKYPFGPPVDPITPHPAYITHTGTENHANASSAPLAS